MDNLKKATLIKPIKYLNRDQAEINLPLDTLVSVNVNDEYAEFNGQLFDIFPDEYSINS